MSKHRTRAEKARHGQRQRHGALAARRRHGLRDDGHQSAATRHGEAHRDDPPEPHVERHSLLALALLRLPRRQHGGFAFGGGAGYFLALYLLELSPAGAAQLAFLVLLAGLAGDLLTSALKRAFGVKDFSPVLARKPVRKSSTGPGRPFTIGKKTTRNPDATVRFQDPCSAMKPPLRYFGGNCVPEIGRAHV